MDHKIDLNDIYHPVVKEDHIIWPWVLGWFIMGACFIILALISQQ